MSEGAQRALSLEPSIGHCHSTGRAGDRRGVHTISDKGPPDGGGSARSSDTWWPQELL